MSLNNHVLSKLGWNAHFQQQLKWGEIEETLRPYSYSIAGYR